jgi:hypothetical protein
MRNPDAVTAPITDGAFGIGIAVEPNYLFNDGYYKTWGMVNDNDFSGAIDHNFSCITGRLEGASNNATVMIEVTHCYEAVPDVNSDFYLTASNSPSPNPGVLRKVAEVARTLPVGDALSAAGRWTANISSMYQKGMATNPGIHALTSGAYL